MLRRYISRKYALRIESGRAERGQGGGLGKLFSLHKLASAAAVSTWERRADRRALQPEVPEGESAALRLPIRPAYCASKGLLIEIHQGPIRVRQY